MLAWCCFKNKIVAIGANQKKTHPATLKRINGHVVSYRFPEPHSELAVYLKIPKQLLNEKLTLVNFRFNKRGQLRMSKPCVCCYKWCVSSFNEIYYSTDHGMVKL